MHTDSSSTIPDELLQLRNSIDQIDEEIIASLARRFVVTSRVGQLKADHGLDSVDPVREQQKLERLRQLAEQNGLNSGFVHDLFQHLFDEVVRNHRSYLKSR